jgi:hypothetical protein
MRRKLTGVVLGAIVAVSGFAVAGLGAGTAATADTTTATTTGTTGTTTGSTTASTTTAATTTAPAASTVTVTVTNVGTTTVTDTETVILSAKVTLCHRVGSRKRHRWVKIKVAPSAVNGHLRHGDRALPARGCGVYR